MSNTVHKRFLYIAMFIMSFFLYIKAPLVSSAIAVIDDYVPGLPMFSYEVFPEGYTNQDGYILFNILDTGAEDIDYVILPDGSYDTDLSYIYRTDENGDYRFTFVDTRNISYEKIVRVVNIDKLPPKVDITGVIDGLSYDNVTPTVNVYDEGISGISDFELRLNGKMYINGTPITEGGDYTLVATARDNAGNESIEQITFTINQPPIVNAYSEQSNITKQESANLIVDLNDYNTNDTVSVFVSAGEYYGDSSFNQALELDSYNSTNSSTTPITFNARFLPSDRFTYNVLTEQYEQNVYFEVLAIDSYGNESTSHFVIRVYNTPPKSKPIRAVEVDRDTYYEVDLKSYFTDIDGDEITYNLTSDNEEAVYINQNESIVKIKALKSGKVTIKITATDEQGVSAEETLILTIKNYTPTLIGAFNDIIASVSETTTLDLETFFEDKDISDKLDYKVSFEGEGVVSSTLEGALLHLTFTDSGEIGLRIRATDDYGEYAEGYFQIKVSNDPPLVDLNNLNESIFSMGSTITIEGRVTDKEKAAIKLYVSLAGIEKEVIVPTDSENFKVQWNAEEIPDGVHNKVIVNIVDGKIEMVKEFDVNIHVDTTPPNKPSIDKQIVDGKVTFVYSSDEPGNTFEWRHGITSWNIGTDNVIVDQMGEYTFRAIDKAGNRSDEITLNITEIDLIKKEEEPTVSMPVVDSPEENVTEDKPSPIIQEPSVTRQPVPSASPNEKVVEIPNPPMLDDSAALIDESDLVETIKEKPKTIQERIKIVLGKIDGVKKEWTNIYVENIMYALDDIELAYLQGNLNEIRSIVEMTNVIEEFRHSRSTKSLFNMHSYLAKNSFSEENIDLFKTTLPMENRALKGIVPYEADKVNLYQPVTEERLSTNLKIQMPTSTTVGKDVVGVFTTNNKKSSKLSVYIYKEGSETAGYIGRDFKWVNIAEKDIQANSTVLSVPITFEKAGTYKIKVQQTNEDGSAVFNEQNVIVAGAVDMGIQPTEIIDETPADSQTTTTEVENSDSERTKMIYTAIAVLTAAILGTILLIKRR